MDWGRGLDGVTLADVGELQATAEHCRSIREPAMDFNIPKDTADYLAELDRFIEREIRPLENKDDNIRFFDHRREAARTDWDRGGLPSEKWEALLREARRAADKAGHYRYPLPKQYGGKDGTNLGIAIIREHLAAKGLGLHNDLQTEHSIVANNVGVLLMLAYGTADQNKEWVDGLLEGTMGFAFGITEPEHGSDATHMDTKAVRDGNLEHRYPQGQARPDLCAY
jgi:alkylation response protein AidB-like acyl-CoA dehydrogenase